MLLVSRVILTLLVLSLLGLATIDPPKVCNSKVKLKISNPVALSNHLEWVHDWNNYRGHAIIKADSQGITPMEALALMNNKSSDSECEFYHTLWYP